MHYYSKEPFALYLEVLEYELELKYIPCQIGPKSLVTLVQNQVKLGVSKMELIYHFLQKYARIIDVQCLELI